MKNKPNAIISFILSGIFINNKLDSPQAYILLISIFSIISYFIKNKLSSDMRWLLFTMFGASVLYQWEPTYGALGSFSILVFVIVIYKSINVLLELLFGKTPFSNEITEKEEKYIAEQKKEFQSKLNKKNSN